MLNKMVIRNMRSVLSVATLLSLVFPIVSAGIGISWDKESVLIPEAQETCLTYKIYNPWDYDTYAEIGLSESLKDILTSVSSEVKFIPKGTSSSEAMPVTFCFKTSSIYKKDCLIGNSFCGQTCEESMKVYSGEVDVMEINDQMDEINGGGSATQMSVSAPLNVKVQCVPYKRSFASLYMIIALIAGVLLLLNYLKNQKETKIKKKK